MNNFQQLYDEALKAHEKGQQEEAKNILLEVLKQSPEFEDAHEALAVILHNMGQYDAAIELIQKWIKLNPDSIMAYTNLSRCYVAKEMIMEAENAQAEARRLTWKEDLKHNKDVPPPVDYEAQIERFKQVIELDPEDVLGYYSLGSTYLEAKQFHNALETFEKAILADPNHSSSYLGYATALFNLGKMHELKHVLKQGIEVADQQGDMIPLKKMEALAQKTTFQE